MEADQPQKLESGQNKTYRASGKHRKSEQPQQPGYTWNRTYKAAGKHRKTK